VRKVIEFHAKLAAAPKPAQAAANNRKQ